MTKKKAPKDRQRSLRGTGSKWTRADGRHAAAIVVPRRDPTTGRITKKRESTTRKSEEEVDAWLVQKRHEIMDAGGALPEPSPAKQSITLREHLEAWLRDSVEPRVAPRTLEKRVWAASNHIAPALGHLPLGKLSPRDIQGLYARLSREGYSVATRREIHVTLRQAMGQAVRWGLLERNPASAEFVDVPKASLQERRGPGQDEEDRIRALTEEQAYRLFAHAERVGSRWRYYYVVAIRAGLRPGEMLGLRWGDLNLSSDPASLRVRRTLDTHGPAEFGPPKSDASRRTVVLHYEAAEALQAQREMLEGEGLPAGARDLVFPSETGSPMNSGNLRKRHLHRHLAEAGLPILSLHELRHSYASIALYEWRLPVEVVADAIGHSSVKITMDRYGHLAPSAQADAIRRLNEFSRQNARLENAP